MKDIANKAGGPVALSKALGLSRGAVSQWAVVPGDRVLAVCELIGWAYTPHQLRPDLYPNPGDALPSPQMSLAEIDRREVERREADRRDVDKPIGQFDPELDEKAA